MSDDKDRPFRVLLVEDNDDFRETTAKLLRERFGFQLTITCCGKEAIQVLDEKMVFDLIITDYFMPNGNGKDLLDHLDQNKIDTPTILFSGGGYSDTLFEHPKPFLFGGETAHRAINQSDSQGVKPLIAKSVGQKKTAAAFAYATRRCSLVLFV